MQRMQPLVREIQRKHKGNRQKITEETMALYREHGVNQFGGCLPVLLQLPILFALYQALIRASNVVTMPLERATSDAFVQLQAALPGITEIERTATEVRFSAPLDGACNLPQFNTPDFSHFLPLNCQLIDPIKLREPVDTTIGWLLNLDLARVDHVFAIPLGAFAISLLAVIAAILQFVQVKMTSPRPNPEDPTSGMTSTMTYTFPLLTIVWGGIFPSGLILYWIVYTGYLVVQQYLIMGWGNLFPIFGWTPSWAPKTDDAPAPRPKRVETTDAPANAPQTSSPSSSAPGGDRGNARPVNRKQGRSKRRGKKR
jgi:YidC/Oxa1 family membrane protein insertase